MKILTAVIIFSTTIILLVVVYLVLYLVIKPLVYSPPVVVDEITLGQGTIFLVNMAQSLKESDDIYTNPYVSMISANITASSAHLNDFRLLASTRSTAYDPTYTNNYPPNFTAITNIFLNEGSGIGVEVVVNIMTGNRDAGNIDDITFYYSYIAEVFGERFFYIMPDGMYGQDSGVNHVKLQMDPSGVTGNLSLRLILPGGQETEICFINDTFSGTAITTQMFIFGQKLVLYNNGTIVPTSENTVPAVVQTITASLSGITFTV